MTTWSLRRIWRNQCASEVKNITTNKKDIHTELLLFTLDFSESSQKRQLDNSLKLVLDAVSNTEQLWRSF